ncbi:MAG TPA: response regulator [Candidatus Limnocylindria bacterium]|nr:response regulator [Candidatus Limnocylindria bacterium]
MPARIQLVAAQPAIQQQLGNMLRRDGYDIITAADGPAALRQWTAERPDLLVCDNDLRGPSGMELVMRIRQAEGDSAHTPIVLLGGGSDVDAKVAALRSGADDYLAKPVHPQELTARVRGLLARFQRAQPQQRRVASGRVVAFYGAKGGVGTTTLAINTAIAAHRDLKRSVCLVDANLQFGDHRVFLDLGPDSRSIVDAVSAGAIELELLRDAIVRHETGVELLLAPSSPEQAEHVSAPQHHLLRVVEMLRSVYELVIVDMDEHFDDHMLDVIGIADRLVVVLTADLSCVKNVRLVLETMAQLQVPQERLMLVLNRANAFTGISVKSVENVLKRPIEHQVVNDYRSAISALNSGTPFMAKRPDSALGKDVLELARLIDKPAAAAVELKQLELSPVR